MGRANRALASTLAGLMLFSSVCTTTGYAAENTGQPAAAVSESREIPENLLANYNTDFEGADGSGNLYWWNGADWHSVARSTYRADEAKPEGGGTGYLRLIGTVQLANGDLAKTIRPEVTYEFSFFARAAAGAGGKVSLIVASASSDWSSTVQAEVAYDGETSLTGSWQQISGTFRIPAHEAHDQVQVQLTGSEGLTFDVDCLVIGGGQAENPMGDNLILNPNFADADLSAWQKGAGGATITAETLETAVGDGITTCGKISGRTGNADCFAQDVTGKVQSGKSYAYSFWVMLDAKDYKDAPAEKREVCFAPFVTAGGETTYWGSYSSGILDSSSARQIEAGEWVRFSGTFTPAFEGEATELVLRIIEQGPNYGAADNGGIRGTYYLTGVELREIIEEKKEIEKDIPDLKDTISSESGLGAGTHVGVCLGQGHLSDDTLMELVEKHFNAITMENELKPDALFNYQNDSSATLMFTEETWTRANGQEVTGTYPQLDYSRAKAILDALKAWNDANPEAKIMVRGHVLVWHSQTPEWFFHEDWDSSKPYVSPGEMDVRQEWFIRTVLTEFTGEDSPYRDMFYGWDVVNEAVSDSSGTYRSDRESSSWWAVYQSPDFIVNAFRYANYYAPKSVELYYNDYNECVGNKVDGIAALLTEVKAHENDAELPTRIDAMGMQSHHDMSGPTVSQLRTAAVTYGSIVGKVQLTELDLKASKDYDGSEGAKASEYTKQAYRYKDIYDVLKEVDAMEDIDVNGLTIWGVIDRYSWLQDSSSVGGGADGSQPQAPLLFDDNYRAKPAFWAFVDPDRLEPFIQSAVVMQALDGADPYAKSPAYDIKGADASFRMIWDAGHLKVKVTVRDAQADENDSVTLYLAGANGGTPEKTVLTRAQSQTAADGYTAEFVLDRQMEVGDTLKFDIVVHNGDSAAAFNDLKMTQDTSDQYFAVATVKPYISVSQGTITVDGSQDGLWAQVPAVPLTITTGSPEATAQAKVLWDSQYLYLWMEVTDPALDKSAEAVHEQDSVEVFLDENNGKTDGYEADDKQFRINFDNELSFNGTKCTAENIMSSTKKTDIGYIVEAAFRWTDVTPRVGDEIGFEMQINDGKGGARIGTRSWYDESGQGWSSPAVFGTIVLAGPVTDPGTQGGGSSSSGSSGGSGSSGSSTPATPSTPAVSTGTESGTGVVETTAKPEATVKDNTSSATVSESMSKEILSQAKEKESETVTVAPQGSGTADRCEVRLPASLAQDLAKETDADLRVETAQGTVTIPNEALSDLGSTGSVTVAVEKKAADTTSVETTANGTPVEDLSRDIRVSLELGTGEVAVLVDDNGVETILTKSIVENGKTMVALSGSATVRVIDNSRSFGDVAESGWYADAVRFASSHELFQGVSRNSFAPESLMTRSMLATVLCRLEQQEGADVTAAFPDVQRDSWYAAGVAWASRNGIVTGYEDGRFGSEDNISQEQLATMLYRYARFAGVETEVEGSLDSYGDSDQVSGWAADAVRWAVGAGLLNGKDGGVLDPAGSATRAEAAAILQRMVRLMVQ